MQTESKSIFQKSGMVVIIAVICNALWGSAIPYIKLGYRYFNITGGIGDKQVLWCSFFIFL